jgi:hypothetical protein
MDRIREWMARHRLISALALTAVVLLGGVLTLRTWASSLQNEVKAQSTLLGRTRELVGTYKKHETRTTSASQKQLSNESTFNISVVKKIANNSFEGRLTDTRSESSRTKDGLTEHMITVSVAGVRRKNLATFLLRMQKQDPAVRTTRLQIRPDEDTQGLITATVEFAAYDNPE